jgi:hypothetical protein
VYRPDGRQLGSFCVITPRRSAPALAAHAYSRTRRANWVCFARSFRPVTARLPQIGFVLPMPMKCTIHHKFFLAKHLPLLFPLPKLGLFGAIDRESRGVRGEPRSPGRVPAGGNWLCFVQSAPDRNGGVSRPSRIGFVLRILPPGTLARPADWVRFARQPKPVVHRFRRLAQIWEERAKGKERDDGPPWASFLLLESAKICVIGGFFNSFRLGDLQHVSSFRRQIINMSFPRRRESKSGAPPRNRVSLYIGAVLHESCGNSVHGRGLQAA